MGCVSALPTAPGGWCGRLPTSQSWWWCARAPSAGARDGGCECHQVASCDLSRSGGAATGARSHERGHSCHPLRRLGYAPLWPLRSGSSEQLLKLSGEHSLLEGTLLRARGILGSAAPICVTAATYSHDVRQAFDRLGIQGRLLIEPEGRNTAPAIAAAALVALQADPNATITVFPSDHVIGEGDDFL